MKFIDTWSNFPVLTEDLLVQETPDDVLNSNISRWFHAQGAARQRGNTVEDLVGFMDAHGVEKTMFCAQHSWSHPDTRPRGVFQATAGMPDEVFDMFLEEQAAAVARHKGRLYGTVLIDPMGGMRAYRQLERAVRDYGCVCARVMGAMVGEPFDHPLFYPVYAKCVDLGIPITINLGFPGPMRRAVLQRPILLDDILLAFPELTVVGTHIGHPWHLETVALLQKHPNFHLLTSGWAPKYIPAEIVQFMNTRGKRQVMWASDFPLLSHERATNDALELPLKEDVRQAYCRDNALEVFKLD
jgi:predicted TIM-barrel fold metal-dependent hydrolase